VIDHEPPAISLRCGRRHRAGQRLPRAFAQAATYDLIIRGGRVIDPSLRIDGVRDVAVARGRIAAVETSIVGNAAATIDARGKLVVPG
jgi:dihydroorotase